MSVCATITVTSGPDRGKVFELTGEMVRLGKAPENEVVLSDAQVGDHHASIVRREGRFAIFTSEPDGLEVDGTEVPSERWVWLPEAATIRMGQRTSVEFVVNGDAQETVPESPAEPATRPVAGRQSTEKSVSTSASGEFVAAARREWHGIGRTLGNPIRDAESQALGRIRSPWKRRPGPGTTVGGAWREEIADHRPLYHRRSRAIRWSNWARTDISPSWPCTKPRRGNDLRPDRNSPIPTVAAGRHWALVRHDDPDVVHGRRQFRQPRRGKGQGPRRDHRILRRRRATP